MKATLKDKAFTVSDSHKRLPSMVHFPGCLFKLCVAQNELTECCVIGKYE